jgi:hypothetical protein
LSVLRLTPQPNRPELGNVAIFAPTRGGKGLDDIVNMFICKHFIIDNDFKEDLYDRTARFRARIGTVSVLDPTGYGHLYDPYQGRIENINIQKLSNHLQHGGIDMENGIFLA